MTEIVFGSAVVIALVLLLSIVVMIARSILMPTRPATLTINGTTRIETSTGQKLLPALNDNGILVPSACAGAGTCGLCRVRITEGGVDALPLEAAKLTNAELKEGMHLACQIVLRDDMSVEVPDDLLRAECYETTVVSCRALTPLIREIALQLPDGVKPDIFAGSFIQITAPPFRLSYADLTIPEPYTEIWEPLRGLQVRSSEEVTRAYSVSNRLQDTEAGLLVFNIRLALPPPSEANAPPGIVSSWLFSLNEGDQVMAAGPFGTFRAQETDREMVFIGGGVGMAPLRALIYEQLEQRGAGRKMSFWYGARSEVELFYAAEFDALAAKYGNFDWTVALSDPQPTDTREATTGFVHSVAFERYLRSHPAPETCEYYLCGPPLMIRAVFDMLDDLGVEQGSIFSDDFGV